jgi:hypothetical protein
MASNELKEMLVDNHGGEVKDWKRLSKRTVKLASGHSHDLRLFENKSTGEKYYTVDEADDEWSFPGEDYIFTINENDDGIWVSFTPESYWLSDKCMWDQHVSYNMEVLYNIPDWIEMDELSENTILVTIPENKSVKDIHDEFIKLGIKFNQSYQDYVDGFM